MTQPGSADVLVLGGGTSGAVLAGRPAELTDASVLLLEAGPDYGPLSSGRRPAELLDASQLPLTHDWGYTSENQIAGRLIHFDRARVIGGCSSHNGRQIAIGHRLDYDGWAARGNPGWAADDLHPYIAAAKQRLRVRQVTDDELTPFGVIGNTLADRLLIHGDRVVGAVAVIGGHQVTIHAGLVAACAGVYGSPAILLRSGIGDPVDLTRIGIRPVHALPGVGRNLHDHPALELCLAGTPELELRSRAFAARAFHPEEPRIRTCPRQSSPSGVASLLAHDRTSNRTGNRGKEPE